MCISNNAVAVQEDGKSDETPTPFEEAIALTGTGRFHRWLLAVCGLALAAVMLEVFSTSFLLPSAQCDFQLTSEDKGLLSAICNIGMVSSSHLWGFLADTRGRRNIIVLTLLLDSLCTILESFAHAFWLFLLLRFLNGFFILGPAAVVYAYIGEFHSAKTRGSAVMWVCIGIGLGVCTQPALAWLVIPQSWSFELPWCTYKSWRIFVFLCSLPSLLSAILIRFTLPESPKFLMVLGEKEKALNVLRHMFASNTGNSPQRFPVKSLSLVEESSPISAVRSKNPILQVVQHMWVQTKPLFLRPFLFKTLLACTIQYGLYASANGLSLWIPDMFNHLAEHGAMYNNSPCSVCEAYATPKVQQNASFLDLMERSETTFSDMNNNTLLQIPTSYPPATYHASFPNLNNYTLLLFCSNNTQVLYDSKNFSLQCADGKIDFTCRNTTVIFSFNESTGFLSSNDNIPPILRNITFNLNVNNSISEDFLRNAEWHTMTLYSCNGTKVVCTSDDRQVEESTLECNSNVDISAFQNTLIIGTAGAISYMIVGYLIDWVGKKNILVVNLLVAGIAGAFINYVYSPLEVLLLVGTFVTLSGMCISVVISLVIDIYPTHLRAMATCLSLMIGRMGSVTINFMLGALLEANCPLMIFILGGVCCSCGLLSLLMPTAKKDTLK